MPHCKLIENRVNLKDIFLVSIAGLEEIKYIKSFYELDFIKKVIIDELFEAFKGNVSINLTSQIYPENEYSHKIINHPVHIYDTAMKELSPSSFIPFCDFGGNKEGKGVKIDSFDSPVCNSFEAIFLNDQLCYEVDPNRFMKARNSNSDPNSITLFIDTNLERQYPKHNGTKGNDIYFMRCL